MSKRKWTWKKIEEIVAAQSEVVQDVITLAVEKSIKEHRKAKNKRQQQYRMNLTRRDAGAEERGISGEDGHLDVMMEVEEDVIQTNEEEIPRTRYGQGNHKKFMRLPTDAERKACYQAFLEATSNASLSQSVCVVCTRELWTSEGMGHIELKI